MGPNPITLTAESENPGLMARQVSAMPLDFAPEGSCLDSVSIRV